MQICAVLLVTTVRRAAVLRDITCVLASLEAQRRAVVFRLFLHSGTGHNGVMLAGRLVMAYSIFWFSLASVLMPAALSSPVSTASWNLVTEY